MGREQSSLSYSDPAVLLTQLLENSAFINLPFEKCRLHCICQKFSVNLTFMMFVFGISLVWKVLYCSRINALVKLLLTKQFTVAVSIKCFLGSTFTA